jgi:hypothetical protein
MNRNAESNTGSDQSATATLTLQATDVTGTHTLEMSGVQESVPAGLLAQAIAARMELPQNVPWALRSDTTGAFLEDALPIGDQIEQESTVTVTPKAHLG